MLYNILYSIYHTSISKLNSMLHCLQYYIFILCTYIWWYIVCYVANNYSYYYTAYNILKFQKKNYIARVLRAILACQCVFWLVQRAKTWDKIWYLWPLPSLPGWPSGWLTAWQPVLILLSETVRLSHRVAARAQHTLIWAGRASSHCTDPGTLVCKIDGPLHCSTVLNGTLKYKCPLNKWCRAVRVLNL